MLNLEYCRNNIIRKTISRSDIETLEIVVPYFVAWVEYDCGVKASIKDGYFSVDLDKQKITLNEEVEKMVNLYIHSTKDWDESDFATNVLCGIVRVYNGSFRDTYESISLDEDVLSLYFLLDKHAPHFDRLSFAGFTLWYTDFEKTKVWAETLFNVGSFVLLKTYEHLRTPLGVSIVFTSLVDFSVLKKYRAIKSMKVVHLDMFSVESDWYLIYDKDMYHLKIRDNLYPSEDALIINDKYLVIYCEGDSDSNLVIKFGLDCHEGDTYSFGYDLIKEEKKVKTVKRKAVLLGGTRL